jgi:hypothetical protein
VITPGQTPDEPSTSPEENDTTDMFAAVRTVLGRTPAEFTCAGELAALMAALPPNTPVSVAETVHIDPALEMDTTPNTTAAAATLITLVDPDDLVDAADRRPFSRLVPGVELGAYIVAAGAAVPEQTRPFPPHERAVDAVRYGALDVVLDADVELLIWMAGMLTDPASDSAPIDTDTVPAWITDVDLREQLGVEAERLRQSAVRLTVLRNQIAEHQAAESDPRA